MKKLLKSSVLFLIGVLVFSSCSSDDIPECDFSWVGRSHVYFYKPCGKLHPRNSCSLQTRTDRPHKNKSPVCVRFSIKFASPVSVLPESNISATTSVSLRQFSNSVSVLTKNNISITTGASLRQFSNGVSLLTESNICTTGGSFRQTDSSASEETAPPRDFVLLWLQ